MDITRTDITKLINVKYYNEDDPSSKSSDHKYELLMDLHMKDLLFPLLLSQVADMDNYVDVPAHWKYLKNTIPTKDNFKNYEISYVLIVEKYQNVAIAYDFTLSKKPAAIFRYCCAFYDNLQCGKVFKGKIGKLYVKTPEKTTLILTDLFVQIITSFSSPPPYSVVSNSNDINVKMSDFLFSMADELQTIKEYESYRIVYNHFGAIYIPSELLHLLDSADSFISGDIVYRIRGIKAALYTCWELGKSIRIYKGTSLYATFNDGTLHLVQRQPILEFPNGTENVQFVRPEEKEEIDDDDNEPSKLVKYLIRRHATSSREILTTFAVEKQHANKTRY